MKFNTYLFILLSTLFACTRTNTNRISENKPIIINLGENGLHSSISSAIQITNVINLETTDSSTISSDQNIKRVIIDAGKIYVMDEKYMSIKVFDETGKYLHSIGSLGMNFGQFINLQDIVLTPHHHTLWALCNNPRKIIEYSLDGKLIREFKIPFFASDIGFKSKNEIYFFVNQNKNEASGNNNILITDSSLNIRENLFPLPTKRKSAIIFAGGINAIGNSLFYNPPLTRTIYELINDSAKAMYKVDFSEKDVPDDFKDDSLNFYLTKHNFLTRNFIKKDNYLGFSYLNKGDSKLSFFNMKTKKLSTSDTKLNQFDTLFNNNIYESDSRLIMLCNPNRFKTFFKTNALNIKKLYPLLYQKLILIKPHDNPSLIFFTFH